MWGIYRLFVGVLLLAGMLAGANAYGQGGATGAISGVVVDTSGGSIASADVQIIDARTESIVRKLPTTTEGIFVATLLPPGNYIVVVNKSGFGEAKATDIEVRVTETTRVTITLKPGAVTEKVEISAQVTAVETSNATTGESLGTATIRELPLATQNYQQLLTLSTGAQSDLNSASQLGRGTVKLFVNGQREDNNNFLIEGISATDYNVAQATYVPLPNPDVIQEFRVQTSLYDASQGRDGGGNINAILKSGTREFHGDAYEFFRNTDLNANDFFLNREGQARPQINQNIFGGSLGGPVVKEKFGYFFLNYQGTRQKSGDSPGTIISTNIPLLPADRSPASLESAFGLPSIDPVISNAAGTGLLQQLDAKGQFGPKTGFVIPSGQVAANCTVGCTPGLTNGTVNTGTFTLSEPGTYNDNQFTSNWDREFHGGKDKISARFFFSDSESVLPFGGGDLQESLGSTLASSISSASLNFPLDTPVGARFLNVTETHLFSATLVNEFRFGYVHINDQLNNVAPVTAQQVGIDRPTNNVTDSIYKFVLSTSGFEIGPAPFANQHQDQNNYDLTDTVSWVKGRHVFRFGGEFTRVNLNKLFPQVFNGELFFTNTPTNGPIAGPTTDFQNFLLGAPQFSFGGGGVYNHQYRSNNYAVFAQDDWKIRNDLTLNLGLRTEIFGAFHDNLCHIGNLNPALANQGVYPFIYPSCVKSLNLAGLSGSANDTTLNNNYSTGIGPRIGLAYDLFGHHNTTIRAGYGIYYVREDVGNVDQLSFQAPFLPVAFGGGPPGLPGYLFLGRLRYRTLPESELQRVAASWHLGPEHSSPASPCFKVSREETPRKRQLRKRDGKRLPGSSRFGEHFRAAGAGPLRRAKYAAMEFDRPALAGQTVGARGRLRGHAYRSPARDARQPGSAKRDSNESREHQQFVLQSDILASLRRTPSPTRSRARSIRASMATRGSSCSPMMPIRTTTHCKPHYRAGGRRGISRRRTRFRARRMRHRPEIPRSIRHSTMSPHSQTRAAFRTSIEPSGWS